MDKTAKLGSVWVATVMPWTMASVPARVDKANWCGEQAWWIGCAKCWAMLRDTTLRRMSPMTMPRTRPFGFRRATSRPSPMAVARDGGMLAAASCWAIWTNLLVLSSSSGIRKVSAVRPDGPGAAPLRVRRRFRMMVAAGMCKAGQRVEVEQVLVDGLVAAGRSAGWVLEFVQGVPCAGCERSSCECLPC